MIELTLLYSVKYKSTVFDEVGCLTGPVAEMVVVTVDVPGATVLGDAETDAETGMPTTKVPWAGLPGDAEPSAASKLTSRL